MAGTCTTTSEESTTLYSSAQMRLLWPLPSTASRAALRAPKSSATPSPCFSWYLERTTSDFGQSTFCLRQNSVRDNKKSFATL